MKKSFLLCVLLSVASILMAAPLLPYEDVDLPIDVRVEDALQRMTTAEKVAMCHANTIMTSVGVPRLGIPQIVCSDASMGVREEEYSGVLFNGKWDEITAFPAMTCLAATWDPQLSAQYGKAVGEEFLYRGKTILLGPGVNIYRTPLNGRNFEYMGEDPYLASRMVVPYIQNVQKLGVSTCVKHLALNNQEPNRHTVNVKVSDRALYEIYLPAFKTAVQEGGAYAVMGSYNLWNGEHCSHNKRLLIDILRNEWGFKGAVLSDWGGAHDPMQSIYNGLDLEFHTSGPDGKRLPFDEFFLANPYLRMIERGQVGTEELDNKVRHILYVIFQTTMSGRRGMGKIDAEAHRQVGYQVASEGIVLLQNDGILPLQKDKKVLVVGENAIRLTCLGGGSSELRSAGERTPLEVLKAGADWQGVAYARGYRSEMEHPNAYEDRAYPLAENRSAAELVSEAVAMAKEAEVVVLFGGLNKSPYQDRENYDRLQYELPFGQDSLVEEILKVNTNVVFVNMSGNAVAMPWKNQVRAIVQHWYGGNESGQAIVDVLTGKVNPSGKLPFTIMARLEDYPAHRLDCYQTEQNIVEEYKDDVFVGYRSLFGKKSVTPLFAFGYGLSYTTFRMQNAQAQVKDGVVEVSVEVTNTGAREGKEVVQVYVHDTKCSVSRPERELKAFKKVNLKAGETKRVVLDLDSTAFSFFSEKEHRFVLEPGRFDILIGSGSDKIEQTVSVILKASDIGKTDPLTGQYTKEQVKQVLLKNQEWVPFPAYQDREGWEKLIGDQRERLITAGEKALSYEWQYIPASKYMEFERSGNRKIMENPNSANNNTLVTLMLAELAEGQGRFIDKIIDGVFYECEHVSWVLSAHLPLQTNPADRDGLSNGRSLPNGQTQIVDLVSGEVGAVMSWAYYFFHEQFDQVNPSISQFLLQEMEKRIFTPYMTHEHWWMGLQGERTNNWNVWCNFNVMQCFLLLERDPERLTEAIWKSMNCVDAFLRVSHEDGACEEGPSYWGHAAGKMFDYLELIFHATGGKVNIFDFPRIKAMGEYIVNSQIGGEEHWVVNFADATAQYLDDLTDLVYRYGTYTHSPALLDYAGTLKTLYPQPRVAGTDIWRAMNGLQNYDKIQVPSTPAKGKNVWYNQTEFLYSRQGDWFLAAKGGHNNESHNHNDIGSCIVCYRNEPMLIDAGTGTYTRQTFSHERYTLWMMQSGWHNLPVINGVEQKNGEAYKAKVIHADAVKGTMKVDIAGAYPAEAQVSSWVRAYAINNEGVTITDKFELNQTNERNEVHFIFWKKEDIARLQYDKNRFEAVVEEKVLPDTRLSNIWGDTIYRLKLIDKQKTLNGTYTFCLR